MEAYRLDKEYIDVNHPNQPDDLTDPYMLHRIQALLAAKGTAYGGNINDDSSSTDHIINTRFTVHRRPGLIRLKK